MSLLTCREPFSSYSELTETNFVLPVTIEACIGGLGIQDICHFTSRDIGYYPFYFQGYGILCSITGILLLYSPK